MDRRSFVRAEAFGLIMLLCFSLSSCSAGASRDLDPHEVAVAAEAATRRDLISWHECTGEIAALADVTLSFRVSGRVAAILIAPGSRVKTSEPLIRLETEDLELDLRRAEAALQAASANLEQLRKGIPEGEMSQLRAGVEQAGLAYENAKMNAERMERLFAEGAVPLQQKEAAVLQADLARSRAEAALVQLKSAEEGPDAETLRAASAQVEQARSARDLVRRQVELATLAAPFDGLVSAVTVQPGEMIGAGTPVVRVVDDLALFAEAWVSPAVAASLRPGGDAAVSPGAETEPMDGKIVEIALSPDGRTRQYRVRVHLETGGGMPPILGSVARLSLETGRREGVIAVPRKALLESGGAWSVFVVEAGVAVERKVSVGLKTPEHAEVLEGLGEGELVVVSGQHFVEDGTPVRIVDEAR